MTLGAPSAAAWLAAGALMMGASMAAAAGDEQARAQLEQKIRLTARLIADSPTAQRIAASGNLQAQAHLDEGRVHQASAEDLLARGDLEGARRAVDDALHHVGLARRLVPDAPSRQAAARARHEQLLASVERLLEAWQGRAAGSGDARNLTAATGLIADARRLAQDGRIDEANQMLVTAEQNVLEGMGRTLHATTLDYTARPANAAEEFQLELARQRSFAELVPVAVRDLRPKPEAQALIERYAEASNGLRAQALQLQQSGDAAQALARIRDATQYLQRALLAAGLALPEPTGSPP